MTAICQYPGARRWRLLEKVVLDDAAGMSRTPMAVADALVAELRQPVDDAQLVELTHVIALAHLGGRFNLALGISAAGFSDGVVCVVPATIPQSAPGSVAT